jgi:hypothetical protein
MFFSTRLETAGATSQAASKLYSRKNAVYTREELTFNAGALGGIHAALRKILVAGTGRDMSGNQMRTSCNSEAGSPRIERKKGIRIEDRARERYCER